MTASTTTAPRWRFSLRFLLLAAAIVPVVVYWFALPTLYAQRFSAAVSRRDFAAAEALCLGDKPFPGRWKEHSYFEPRAIVKHLTLADLWAGKRELFVGIAYGDNSGIASAGLECTATRHGIEIGMALP